MVTLAAESCANDGFQIAKPSYSIIEVISVQNAGKRYDRRWIFRNLSFSIKPNKIVALCGKNGSGKSTLLRALAGLLPLTAGEINYPKGELRELIGFSGIDSNLYGDLTAIEHLDLSAKLRGYEVENRELLESVHLGYASNQLVREFSTGMRSRLRLAIAIQIHPPYLLLDEPGAALDQEGIKTLHRIIENQVQSGSVIIATNDPDERALATDVIDLDQL